MNDLHIHVLRTGKIGVQVDKFSTRQRRTGLRNREEIIAFNLFIKVIEETLFFNVERLNVKIALGFWDDILNCCPRSAMLYISVKRFDC